MSLFNGAISLIKAACRATHASLTIREVAKVIGMRGGWGKTALWGKTSWASYPTSISMAKIGRLDAQLVLAEGIFHPMALDMS